jgi:hypothetical protein
MATVRRLYHRTDRWAKNLSRTRYAALLGVSSAVGILVIGLLISRDVFLLRALTMGTVMFALEAVFGRFQATEE